MDLPVMPPVQPMLAKSVKGIPDPAKHGGLIFEPKRERNLMLTGPPPKFHGTRHILPDEPTSAW